MHHTHHHRILALLVLFAGGRPIAAQQSPDQTLKQITTRSPEATVSLFAAEPMVQNPTSLVVDSRGRVWITEGLNYRLWAGSQRGKFQRIAGADKIKVLEDTDGDGRADKVTVFAENIFPVPMGLALEEHWEDGVYRGCRVFVGNSPNLLVLEDRDGDDRADHREPLLTGFRGVDSDHGIHGLQLGIDGWLYFTVGDTRYGVNHNGPDQPTFDVTDRSGRRLKSARYGTVCRVRPDGTQMEVLAYRLRNDYEVCVDSFGRRFFSDNDDDGHQGCRVGWVLPGGNFGYRMPGARLHNAEEMPGVVPKIVGTGNGSPCGLLAYEGTLFPFRGAPAILEVDAGTRQVNFFPFAPHGASFRTNYKVWLKGDDPWFRPIDLDVAPDGTIYLCDWYDAGVGGNRVSDQELGRIYHIAPVGFPPARASRPPKTLEDALEAFRSPNRTRQLAGRAWLIAHPQKARPALGRMASKGKPVHRARAYWTLYALDPEHPDEVVRALKDDDPVIRELAVKILSEDSSREAVAHWPGDRIPPPRATHWLDQLRPLADDPHANVRRQLLTGLRYVPTSDVAEELLTLTESWDGKDRFYLEALRLAWADREPSFVTRLFHKLQRRVEEFASRDDVRIRDPLALPPYYPVSSNNAYLRPEDRLPPASPATQLAGIAWVLGRPEAVDALAAVYRSPERTADEREALERALARLPGRRPAQIILEALHAASDPVEQTRLLRLLAQNISGVWKEGSADPKLREAVRRYWEHPDTAPAAGALAAAARLAEFRDPLQQRINDTRVSPSVRASALEALAQLDPAAGSKAAKRIIESMVSGTSVPAPLARVALALVSRQGKQGTGTLVKLALQEDLPADVRRQALVALTQTTTGARRLLQLVEQKKVDRHWQNLALSLLNNHPDPKLRQQARQLWEKLGGRQKRLVDFDAVLSRKGDARRGERLFFKAPEGSTACGSCHRVRGQGSFVGPDLSTIGLKYGKREMLFHIVEPSAVINHNYTGEVLQLEDGRIVSGIVVSEDGDSVTLMTPQADRWTLSRDEILARKRLEESVMPANLCDALTDDQLADLLAFLATLRTPVIEIRSLRMAAPVTAHVALPADPPFDFSRPLPDPGGKPRRWQIVEADRDGFFHLPAEADRKLDTDAWLAVRLRNDVEQDVRLALRAAGGIDAFINRRHVPIPHWGIATPMTAAGGIRLTRRAAMRVPKGTSILWVHIGLLREPNLLSLTLIPTRPGQLHILESAAEATAD